MRRLSLILASTLAIAGCGGGNDTAAPATQTVTVQKRGGPAPTKAAFIKEVDALCQQFRTENGSLKRQLQDVGTPTSADERHSDADLIRQYADKLQGEAARVRQLQTPRGDAAIINSWLSTGQSAVSLFRELGDAYDSGDAGRIRSLGPEIRSQSDRASGIAQGYGFKVCGQN